MYSSKKGSLIRIVGIALLAVLAAALGGCATSVPMQITKPAEVSLAGARKIAVMDVGFPQAGSDRLSFADLFKLALARAYGLYGLLPDSPAQRVASYATDRLVTVLLNTDYFEIVSPRDLGRALRGTDSQSMSAVRLGSVAGAQAILVAHFDTFDSRTRVETRLVEETDARTGQKVRRQKQYLVRETALGFTYRVVDTRDGRVMASKRHTADRREERELGKGDLPTEESVYRQLVDEILPKVARQIAPYRVTEYRRLMKDERNDARLERADELVKNRLYDKALDLFLAVWNERRNPAAGFNAAIMYEALGDLDSAVATMSAVADVSSERRVANEYRRLLKSQEERREVARQMGAETLD